MKTRIRELGTYTVAVDTVPPEITPVGKNTWGRNGKVVYRLKDKETGIRAIVELSMENLPCSDVLT